jgi:hypothetical protein
MGDYHSLTISMKRVNLTLGSREVAVRFYEHPDFPDLCKLILSERVDLNHRPPEPHSGALAGLRHAPLVKNRYNLRDSLSEIYKKVVSSPNHSRSPVIPPNRF